MGNRMRIAVLMGGPSSEREVSLRSGAAVVEALTQVGHDVVPVDVKTETGDEFKDLRCDVAFLALHGRFGEDGTVQRMLEAKRIPYTGADAESSAAAMDKIETKRRFKFFGVDTPQHRVIGRGDSHDLLEQCARALGYPVVIKPRSEGSSVGVTVHQDWTTLLEGAIAAFQYGPIALMEKFIAGREMTVGILDGQALPIVEIRPKGEFFDYKAKYEDPETAYLVNPPLADLDRRRITKAAMEAYGALHCEAVARVDLIFSHLHSVHVLEANTIPGLTPRSLLPKAAQAMGIDFPELCQRLVDHGLKRRRKFGWAAAVL